MEWTTWNAAEQFNMRKRLNMKYSPITELTDYTITDLQFVPSKKMKADF